MHAAAADSDFAKHLFEVVFKGLNDNDYDNIRQYLILFESLLLAQTCDWHNELFGQMLNRFLNEIISENGTFYLWMDQTLEWIFKITGKHEFIRNWFN